MQVTHRGRKSGREGVCVCVCRSEREREKEKRERKKKEGKRKKRRKKQRERGGGVMLNEPASRNCSRSHVTRSLSLHVASDESLALSMWRNAVTHRLRSGSEFATRPKYSARFVPCTTVKHSSPGSKEYLRWANGLPVLPLVTALISDIATSNPTANALASSVGLGLGRDSYLSELSLSSFG